jgi:hypothetical protein
MDLDKADSGNAAIEFHDSEVAAVHQEGAMLTIEFSSAYVHRSEGTPCVDAGTGWAQQAMMVLSGCQCSGEFPKLPCSLSGGSVNAGCEVYRSVIPVPFVYVGATCVNLSFEDGSEVQLTASELRLDTIGEATYIERFM